LHLSPHLGPQLGQPPVSDHVTRRSVTVQGSWVSGPAIAHCGAVRVKNKTAEPLPPDRAQGRILRRNGPALR
jgi:hypothetical protein